MIGDSCDYAACTRPAVERSGGWAFCEKHAEDDRRIAAGEDPEPEDFPEELLPPEANGHGTEARARMHLRHGEQPCRPCGEAAARAAQDRSAGRMTTPTTQSTGLGLLLEQASAHQNPKVKRLADKIEGLLADLRALLAADEAAQEARDEIARLERQLAEAKAKLRGGPAAAAPKPRAQRNYSPEALEKMRANAARMRERKAAQAAEAVPA